MEDFEFKAQCDGVERPVARWNAVSTHFITDLQRVQTNGCCIVKWNVIIKFIQKLKPCLYYLIISKLITKYKIHAIPLKPKKKKKF